MRVSELDADSVFPARSVLVGSWNSVRRFRDLLLVREGRSERSGDAVRVPTTAYPGEEERSLRGGGDNGSQRPRRRWLVYLLVLVVLVIVAWAIVRVVRAPVKPSGMQQRGGFAVPVVAAKAHKGDIDVFFTGLGTVTPIYTVTVRTRVDGQLMQVLFKEGQDVRKGELLAEIDDRPYKVQLAQAEAQLAKDQAALNNAKLDLARYQALIKRNAVAQQVLATQEATVAQTEAALKADQSNIDAAKLNIVYCHITAPITGRIGLRLVDPGNMVHASDQNGLLVITQVQPISVIFTIAEDQLPPVLKRVTGREELGVAAYSRDNSTKLTDGSLSTIDNQIDPTTGTLKLRATFDNRDNRLFPNQFVNARLLVEHKHDVTLVPTSVIQRSTNRTYIYLVNPDSKVEVRDVTVGASEGDQVEITSGLQPGDVAVLAGVDKLQNGSKVTVHMQGENPPQGRQQGATQGPPQAGPQGPPQRQGAPQSGPQNGPQNRLRKR